MNRAIAISTLALAAILVTAAPALANNSNPTAQQLANAINSGKSVVITSTGGYGVYPAYYPPYNPYVQSIAPPNSISVHA